MDKWAVLRRYVAGWGYIFGIVEYPRKMSGRRPKKRDGEKTHAGLILSLFYSARPRPQHRGPQKSKFCRSKNACRLPIYTFIGQPCRFAVYIAHANLHAPSMLQGHGQFAPDQHHYSSLIIITHFTHFALRVSRADARRIEGWHFCLSMLLNIYIYR